MNSTKMIHVVQELWSELNPEGYCPDCECVHDTYYRTVRWHKKREGSNSVTSSQSLGITSTASGPDSHHILEAT